MLYGGSRQFLQGRPGCRRAQWRAVNGAEMPTPQTLRVHFSESSAADRCPGKPKACQTVAGGRAQRHPRVSNPTISRRPWRGRRTLASLQDAPILPTANRGSALRCDPRLLSANPPGTLRVEKARHIAPRCRTFAITGSAPVISNMESHVIAESRVHGVVALFPIRATEYGKNGPNNSSIAGR
jgi:hypothetical protein